MMFKLVNKYYRINKTERKILNRTFIWLIYAFILVRVIPLKWFNSLLGEFKKELKLNLTDEQIQLVEIFSKNLKRLKRRLPWKVKCFDEAIAGKKVLEKYMIPSTLYLGVAKDDKKRLIAHAWLKSGHKFITGEKAYSKYSVVGFYS